MLSDNLHALLDQLISQLARTHERIIQMQAIHRAHDRQIDLLMMLISCPTIIGHGLEPNHPLIQTVQIS